MQWIACHLPKLPLDIFASPTPEPFAVSEGRLIAACDKKAVSRGVRAGMTVAAASAIAPRLRVKPRDPAGETEALLGLAGWCGQFTPHVALEFPDCLLLEVSGSLKLFGGLDRIASALSIGFAEMSYTAFIACAPTPRAAAWLGRGGHKAAITDMAALEAAIADLPVSLFDTDRDTLEAFANIGIRTIGALLRQPRGGIARRFGQAMCNRLDQSLGQLPDPRTWVAPPERFAASVELQTEVSQAEALIFAARRLLVQLEGFLAARQAGVQRFTLRLAHREGRATKIDVGLVSPSRGVDHFTLLLRERLGTTPLPEPARALRLEADDIQPLPGEALALFTDTSQPAGDWRRLIERLRARLGSDAVTGITLAAEHRPERSSVAAEPGTKPIALAFGERPFWLLPDPQPLQEISGAPHYEGALALVTGPERIESGWWDGDDAKRDYFIARTQEQSYVWIYRERAPAGRWYLQGVFA